MPLNPPVDLQPDDLPVDFRLTCFRRSEHKNMPVEVNRRQIGAYRGPYDRLTLNGQLHGGYGLTRRYPTPWEKRLVKFLADRDGEATVGECRRALGGAFLAGLDDAMERGLVDYSTPCAPWRGVGDVYLRDKQ